MIAPELEAYFQRRLEWKLEIEPEIKSELRRQLDNWRERFAGRRICRSQPASFSKSRGNLSFSGRDEAVNKLDAERGQRVNILILSAAVCWQLS